MPHEFIPSSVFQDKRYFRVLGKQVVMPSEWPNQNMDVKPGSGSGVGARRWCKARIPQRLDVEMSCQNGVAG